MINQYLAVSYQSKVNQANAEAIADKLNLTIDKKATWQIYLSEVGLGLKGLNFTPYYPDFRWITWKDRWLQGKNQALVKACLPKKDMQIVDVTAGWGRDAAILASFGAKVLMIERNPIIATLLQYALDNRDQVSKDKLQLILCQGDAIAYLNECNRKLELIYLDPMHPSRKKTALVKKELQLLQNLIGPDLDARQLLEISIQKSKKVVMKWPSSEVSLLSCKDSVEGKTVRFDRFY